MHPRTFAHADCYWRGGTDHSSFRPAARDDALTMGDARWDVDGDGSFDTTPTTLRMGTTTYSLPGLYRVVAELTDEGGDSSLSVPIGIRVERREVSVRVDIKPGDETNHLNPRSHGGLWIAVLSSAEFDPLQIDVSTVRFGPGAAAALRGEMCDLNGDGAHDLVLRFEVSESQIRCGDTEARLTGSTVNGLGFAGSDLIRTAGCQAK